MHAPALENPQRKVHFIGIGGIGMSGIARMYLSLGYQVQGSDVKKSAALAALEKMGAKVLIGHDAAHVDGANLVVYSSSIREKHPEREAAREKGVKIIHRAEALADLCRDKYTIAVTGTHGKTTTTALVGTVLKEAVRHPSIVVGGLVKFFGGNACRGRGREIVIEADESDSSFLKFSPDLEVITNIEKEHMDHFRTVRRVEKAYRDFVGRLAEGGRWIGCAEDPKVLALAAETVVPAILYGFKQHCDFYATDVVECPGGRRGLSFVAWSKKGKLGDVRMRILGRHNVLNALAAIAVGRKLGIGFPVIQNALARYEGAARRFDVKYEDRDWMIVDDYAHHPTEVRRTLAAARYLGRRRVFVLFQPHRYSRTALLLREFGVSFGDADKVVITDIYGAGEASRPGVSGERVAKAVGRSGHPDVVFVARAGLADFTRSEIRRGDLVITMGAGDIGQVADEVAEFLKVRRNVPAVFKKVRGNILTNEPLARHTSLKIGGPAEFWIEPHDLEDLKKTVRAASRLKKKIHVFGAGSNVLPPDKGLRGAVLHLGSRYFKEIRFEKGRVIARAGVPNPLFIRFALERGLGGFEFLSGIPGNIGGAIVMNAGSHGQAVEPFLESVTLVGFDGKVRTLKKSEIHFGYRSSGIQHAVVAEAAFSFPKTPKSEVQKKLDEYSRHRSETQDLRHPSAGCMFKNPPDGALSSGRLIDEAGLKGFKVGQAQVSERHANFIINLGGATAGDVKRLIHEVRQKVFDKSHVKLETEVKIL